MVRRLGALHHFHVLHPFHYNIRGMTKFQVEFVLAIVADYVDDYPLDKAPVALEHHSFENKDLQEYSSSSCPVHIS